MATRTMWIHERIVHETIEDFCQRYLPDSKAAQAGPGDGAEVYYELADAVPNDFRSRAFIVDAQVPMVDELLMDAQLTFTLEIPGDLPAYVHGIHCMRETGDEDNSVLAWDENVGWHAP